MPGLTEHPACRGKTHFLSFLLLLNVVAFLTLPLDRAFPVDWHPTAPVRVAVYDVAPYGAVGANGTLSGVSADLWRRVAQDLGWDYKLTPVSQMELILRAGRTRSSTALALSDIWSPLAFLDLFMFSKHSLRQPSWRSHCHKTVCSKGP